jgi:hypothetical protein
VGHGKVARKIQGRDIFGIYENNRWGGKPGTYDSGSGSRADVTASYILALRALIRVRGSHASSTSDVAISKWRGGFSRRSSTM